MEPTTILSQEHRVIEVVLGCLERLVEESRNKGELELEPAEQIIDFIRSFADGCHHGKEEEHLFAAMIDKGMPRNGGPIGQMFIEHDQGRDFVRGMDENAKAAASGNTRALETFAANALGYIQLLRAHIQKEDNILFSLANRMLSADDQKQLLASFNKVETEHMGHGTHQKYLRLAETLADRFGVSKENIVNVSCGCGHQELPQEKGIGRYADSTIVDSIHSGGRHLLRRAGLGRSPNLPGETAYSEPSGDDRG